MSWIGWIPWASNVKGAPLLPCASWGSSNVSRTSLDNGDFDGWWVSYRTPNATLVGACRLYVIMNTSWIMIAIHCNRLACQFCWDVLLNVFTKGRFSWTRYTRDRYQESCLLPFCLVKEYQGLDFMYELQRICNDFHGEIWRLLMILEWFKKKEY